MYVDVLHIEWLLYYWRCLFCVLELDASYKWQVTHPDTHHSLFPISYFCIYSVLRHITWKLQVICGHSAYLTTPILLETFFVWFRVALEIQLESYGPRRVSVVLWYDILCAYIAYYTSLFGIRLRLTTKLTYLMTAYYAPNGGFTTNDASFL